MSLKIELSNKNNVQFERMLTVIQIGLLTALEKNLISIEEAEGYLFSPYTSEVLSKNDIHSRIIDIVNIGCELEDIQSLLPHKLKTEISDLKYKALNNLANLLPPTLPTEKIIKVANHT